METRCYTVYKFDELTDEQKEKAIEKLYDINMDYDGWSECVIEDAKEIGKLIGIHIDEIYFSGFSSQGDGACFEGSYNYEKGSVDKVKEYAPKNKILHRIAEKLQTIQKKHFYKLNANVEHRGHYYHEMCTDIKVYKDGDYLNSDSEVEAGDEIKDALRDFMRWIYKKLESEYEYTISKEAIIETIEANDYDFNENGEIA